MRPGPAEGDGLRDTLAAPAGDPATVPAGDPATVPAPAPAGDPATVPTPAAVGTGSFPYRLVATDLDGTLLRGDDTVSPRTRAALDAVRASGAAHLVVTGRGVPWTREILRDLGYTGLAVCGQGAQLYHAGEDRLVTSVTLDRRTAQLAVARIEDEVGPLALSVSRDGLYGDVVVTPDFRVLGSALPVRRAADRAELWAAPLTKVYVQHPRLADDTLAKAALRAAGDLVGVMMSGADIVELLPLGLTKARGLSLAARRLKVPAAATIAFGDMPNDLPMFRWAGYGVAMANAHPELLAVADEVTLSHEEDGIAVVLERLLG